MKFYRWVGMVALLISSVCVAASFDMKTVDGLDFTLETIDNIVTVKTTEFELCGENVGLLAKVKLWMPDHNHGSTPVMIGELSDGCRKLTRVNFTMPGDWDVRVQLSNGDTGAFKVPVELR
jgi:hypothetical protein